MNTVTELANRLLTLSSEALASRERLRALYPDTPLADPRTGVAFNLRQISGAIGLSFIHYDENLRDPAWWRTHGFEAIGHSPEEIRHVCREYELALYATLRLMPVSYLEAGFRRVVRAIDPSACSGGGDSFAAIYQWLFKRLEATGWSWDEGDPRIFLDLCRLVRNTVHNNGVFYPRTEKAISLNWRGRTYAFESGRAPDLHDGWGFTAMSLEDLTNLNESVMSSEILRGLPPIP